MKLQHLAVTICAAAVLISEPATAYASTAGATSARPTCVGQSATIVGTNGDDVLAGTSHRDVIVAKAGHDAIDGLGGNDLICAEEGSDTIAGGGGADLILAGRGIDVLMGGAGKDRLFGQRDGIVGCDGGCIFRGDTLVGGAGNDYFDGGDFSGEDTVSYTASAVPIRVDAAASTVEAGVFTDRLAVGVDQTVKGSRYDDRMLGAPGSDSFRGGSGDDRLIGHGGADRLYGDIGNNVIDGGPGDDSLGGYDGDNTVDGGAGSDEISLGDGDDLARAGPGDDWFSNAGSGGVDRVLGGLGNDDVDFWAPDVGDHLDGGPGRDSVRFESALDGVTVDLAAGTLTAPVQATVQAFETVAGTNGPDIISGSPADNRFSTLSGDDTIDGRAGTDTADGGNGTDSCVNVETAVNCENG